MPLRVLRVHLGERDLASVSHARPCRALLLIEVDRPAALDLGEDGVLYHHGTYLHSAVRHLPATRRG